jgi:DNA repair protein SbcC/Rad50
MLQSLTVRNFQTHKKHVVELDRVTTFVGRNDAGKSALLRALRWVCLNKAPTNAMRWGAKFMSVSLTIDGHTVKRKRTKSGNLYSLDGKQFRAFGSEVPDEIRKLLNVSEVNFQRQHDPLFWFSNTPGEVSRQLNQIVDLAIIDEALGRAAATSRKARTVVEVSEQRLKGARKRKEELSFVPDLVDAFDELEQLQNDAIRKRGVPDTLGFLVNGVREARGRLGRASQTASATSELLERGQRAIDLGAEVGKLRQSITIIQTTTQTAAVDAPDTEPLESLSVQAVRLSAVCDTLQTLLTDIEKASERVWDTEQKEMRANELLKRASKGKCPVCGRSRKTIQ